jgi:phosphoribosyl-ATP pyrophosphohydrolase/phosphoribosyl-AMP cyclohydrolase
MSSQFLEALYEIVKSRRDRPQASSYTSHLLAGGLQDVVSKFGEESAEGGAT